MSKRNDIKSSNQGINIVFYIFSREKKKRAKINTVWFLVTTIKLTVFHDIRLNKHTGQMFQCKREQQAVKVQKGVYKSGNWGHTCGPVSLCWDRKSKLFKSPMNEAHHLTLALGLTEFSTSFLYYENIMLREWRESKRDSGGRANP